MSAPVLRTRRLILVPAVEGDVPALCRHWNTQAVRRFLWDDSPVEVDTIRKVVVASERDFARAGYGIWMVRRMEKEPLIGTCGLRGTATGEVELLFSLDPVMWGLGLATEAARAVLDYTRSADRVVAFTDSGNVASQRVLARLGMTPCDSGDVPTTTWRRTVLAPATAEPSPLS